MDRPYDLVVVGTGVTSAVASRCRQAGWTVAVVDSRPFGGTCALRGCVPKKLLVYASRFSHEFEDAAGYGWTVGEPSFDWPTLIANKDREIARLEAAYIATLERSKADAKPFGLTLIELTPALAAEYRLEGQKGLLVKEINPESYIADVKASNGVDALGEGDLIQRLNREPVRDLKTFSAAVGGLKKGDAVVLHVIAVNGVTRLPQLKIVQFTVQ